MDADEREGGSLPGARAGLGTVGHERERPRDDDVAYAIVASVDHRPANGRTNGQGTRRPVPLPTPVGWPVDGTARETAPAPPVRRPAWQRRAKRAVDLVVAPVVLALTAPIVAVAAAAIRLETPGPVVFRQRRIGAGGRPFVVFKLRTMYDGNDDRHHRDYVAALLDGRAERRGGLFKLADDHRITAVGRILRSCSIDEIPQLVNVLRGEMSLVGPRPALPSEIELYDDRQRGRLEGVPGITGLWQVSGRAELGYAEMIELDLRYLEQWSFWSDLAILARTPLAVLSRRGAV